MDSISDRNTPFPGLSTSQQDAADYAVTGLKYVINGVEGKSTQAGELAVNLVKDIQELAISTEKQAEFSEQGWDKLQAVSRDIIQTSGLPADQTNNLLVIMAGVTSAVSTVGLVKAPEREVEQTATKENAQGRWASRVKAGQHSNVVQR